MMLLEFHLEVSDLEAAKNLYSHLLPYSRIEIFADRLAVALILNDGSAFGFWAEGKRGIHGGRGGRQVHFAFQIEDQEYNLYKEKIISLGMVPLEHVWGTGARSVYFFDLDGHQGENYDV